MSSLGGDQDTVADPALPSATVTVILNGPMDAVVAPIACCDGDICRRADFTTSWSTTQLTRGAIESRPSPADQLSKTSLPRCFETQSVEMCN